MDIMKSVTKSNLFIILYACVWTFFKCTSGSSSRTVVYGNDVEHVCMPLEIKFCEDVLLYNETFVPNLLFHPTQEDARRALFEFKPLININCSESLKQFLCLIYAPPCTDTKGPVPVCKSLCEMAFTKDCRKIMTQASIHPIVLDCNRYPSSGLCITPDQVSSGREGEGGYDVTPLNPFVKGPDSYYSESASSETIDPTLEVDLFLLVTSGAEIQLLNIKGPNKMDTITIHRRVESENNPAIDLYLPKKYIYWASTVEAKIYRGTLENDRISRRPVHLSMFSWSSFYPCPAQYLFPSLWLLFHITIVETTHWRDFTFLLQFNVTAPVNRTYLLRVKTWPRPRLLTEMYNIRNLIDTETSTVTSIAVDWNLKVLFWSEIFVVPGPQIRTSSLSGRGVTTVIQNDLVHPVSLTLDPSEGQIFWIDKKGTLRQPFATIESYSIVTQKRTLIRNVTSLTIRGGGRPTALITDLDDKRLFWVDSRSKSLHSMNYDGSDHVIISQDNERLNDPESIIIKGDYLFWMDRNSLIRVNKYNGSDELLIKVFERNPPQSLRLYEETSAYKSNYDRASLTKTWRDLSSSESMEDKPNYDADEYYYDDSDTQRRKNTKTKPKSSASHIDMKLFLISTLALSVLLFKF